MLRQFMTLVALLMLQVPAFAQGTAEEGSARAPTRRANAQPSFKTSQPARAASPPTTSNCRMPGASYDLETASLPLCKNVGTSIRSNPVYNPEAGHAGRDVHAKPPPVAPRDPASLGRSRPTELTFDSYMNANASNPAISGRRAIPQEAFKDWSKPAVITGSSSDLDSKNPDGTSAAPTGNAAAIAPGGVAPAGGTPAAITPGASAPLQDAYPSSSSSSGSAPMPNNR